METKLRLESSLTAKMESKWRLKASLKGQMESKWLSERRSAGQVARQCGPRGAKLGLEDGLAGAMTRFGFLDALDPAKFQLIRSLHGELLDRYIVYIVYI